MKDAVIYCRTSTRDQHPENQKIQLIKYAKDKGWKFDIYEEKETTRKTRPIKEKVLKLLRQNKYKNLLIWKLDRWGRSSTELSMEIEELINNKVNFVSLQDIIDISTATGKLYFHIICAFAEFERSIISERTIAGLERAKKEGRIGGRPKKDPLIYDHYCSYPGCRIKIERGRRLCHKHLSKYRYLTKKGGL